MQVYKQRANPDEEMLSMISPEEWGPSGPEYVGGSIFFAIRIRNKVDNEPVVRKDRLW